MIFERVTDFSLYDLTTSLDDKVSYWARVADNDSLEKLRQRGFVIVGYDADYFSLFCLKPSKKDAQRTFIDENNPLSSREGIIRTHWSIGCMRTRETPTRSGQKFKVKYSPPGRVDVMNRALILLDEQTSIEAMTLENPLIGIRYLKGIRELERLGFVITSYFPGFGEKEGERINYVLMGNPTTTPTSAIDPIIEEQVKYFREAFSQARE